jgi:hypothetical protein
MLKPNLQIAVENGWIPARTRSCDCAPKANGGTITVWESRRIDHRYPTYSRHRDESLPRHPHLLSVLQRKRRSHRDMCCRRISTPRSDSLMINNSSDCFRRRTRRKKDSVSEGGQRKRRIKVVAAPLTQGKLNAVRAAFKAGVTPSRIAREFGM